MRLSIFSCAFWSFVCFLWRNVYWELLPFFDWVVCFFDIEQLELFIYFVIVSSCNDTVTMTNGVSSDNGVVISVIWCCFPFQMVLFSIFLMTFSFSICLVSTEELQVLNSDHHYRRQCWLLTHIYCISRMLVKCSFFLFFFSSKTHLSWVCWSVA